MSRRSLQTTADSPSKGEGRSLTALFAHLIRSRSGPTNGRSSLHVAKPLGETGGTLGVKDEEIRVRMGKPKFQSPRGRDTATGVLPMECVETKGVEVAPQEDSNLQPFG